MNNSIDLEFDAPSPEIKTVGSKFKKGKKVLKVAKSELLTKSSERR
jgi:hypothetical protein